MKKDSIYNKTLRNAADIYLHGPSTVSIWVSTVGHWGYIRLDLCDACFEDWKPIFQYLEMGWTLFGLF